MPALREILIGNLQEEENLLREKHRNARKNKEPQKWWSSQEILSEYYVVKLKILIKFKYMKITQTGSNGVK